MKDDCKDTYGFETRLATKYEINTLSRYLAREKWLDDQKNKKALKVKATKKQAVEFIRKEKSIILELIGDTVLVQDYKKFDISIFIYNYTQSQNDNTVLSMMFRVLKTPRGMEVLENDDAIFELSHLKKYPYHKRRSKTGRHDRPKNESVQKAIEIREYLKVNPDENRDRVCNEFGLSKTTYYRVIRWLADRNQ